MSNVKERLLTDLDSGQVFRDIHNEEDRSIRVLINNDLVPNKFTKVVCTYVGPGGNGEGEVETATYYDSGVNQLSSFIPNADQGGQKEVTYVDMSNMINLHNKYFVVYDSAGKVGIYFIVDGASSTAPSGTLRNISVDLSSLDNPRIAAIKLKQKIELDSEFLSLTVGNVVFIISSSSGNKPDSYDGNTGLNITSVNGESPDTLNNKYFFIWTPSSKFHVWFNVDSFGVDPSPAASTGIEVDIASTDTQEVVATKIINKINNGIYFGAYKRNGRVNILSKQAGLTNSIQDFNTKFNFFMTETEGSDKSVIKTLVLTYDSDDNLTEVDSF